jgi:transposase
MAMTIMMDAPGRVTVGIDTHSEFHVATALDSQGRKLDEVMFASTADGHRGLDRWLAGLGEVDAIGIEGTGSWGAGLASHLTTQGHVVREVDRPNRALRRTRGKSDPIDAEAAARAVQAGTATGTPKSRTGIVEAIRVLRVARRSAMKARSQALVQLQSLVAHGPQALRDELRGLRVNALVDRSARFRPGDRHDPTAATKTALRSIARRCQHLNAELAALDTDLERLVREAAPNLVALHGVGTDTAGQLLVTAGDNPHRLHAEAAFANLCGVAPLPASSGKTRRHRLSRSGDRQANAALHRIVICRLRWNPETQYYMERRTKEGLSKREIIRCLKRFVARDIYQQLQNLTLDNP